MTPTRTRLSRLRDLILLFLTSVFGTTAAVLTAWRILNRNSIFLIFQGKSMETILALFFLTVVSGAVYVFLPGGDRS